MDPAARSLSFINAISEKLFSTRRQIKEGVSKTGQRALGIDDVRFKLDVALQKLDRVEAELTTLRNRFDRSLREAQINQPILDGALRRLQGQKMEIASLIDIGASNGSWSRVFAEYFPDRDHLLIDANQVHEADLKKACQEHPRWRYALTAVGATQGELYFDSSDPLGGHLAETPHNENYRPCPVTTIDSLLERQPLPGPFMIKLDTHGVEIPILSGAAKTLQQTTAIVIEAYNFTFGQPAVPFWDLCRHMLGLGFRPLDIFDLLYRELDNAFWQLDLLFVRSDLPLFENFRYFVEGRH
jgi:FkbM family methyltransferase